MSKLGSYLFGLVIALLVLAAAAPSLIALCDAVLPLVIVLAVAAIVGRLVFFHTRRF